MCKKASRRRGKKNRDVVFLDTAGRLAIDEEMMQELEQIKSRVQLRKISCSSPTR